MKKYLFAMLMLFTITNLWGQAFLIDRISRTDIKPDSLFNFFVPPVLDSNLVSNYLNVEKNYQFYYFISIYSAKNEIRRVKIQPIYIISGSTDKSNPLWTLLENSIDSVSKYWKLKPINHLIKESYSYNLKNYYENVNADSLNIVQRPWNGKQSHCFLLNIYFNAGSGPITDGFPYQPMLFYWMNINPDFK